MSLTLIQPPAVEPVSIAIARLQCHVDGTDEDELLSIYIGAARAQAEALTGRALIDQTWQQTLDAFPVEGIQLLKPPVSSIPSVTYVDANGAVQTLSSAGYALDSAASPSGWLLPADGTTWPATDDVVNAVRVQMRCGYGPAATDVPAPLRQWMLRTIAYFYDQRTAADVAGKASALPDRFYHSLLDAYFVPGVGSLL